MKRGKTFIICGPSGVGKGTVVVRLLASDPTLYFSVSATTRAPRPGEVDGMHYHFLTMEQFEKWIEEDQFLEHAQFVGNRYGTPQLYVDKAMDQGRDVLLDIEVQGAAKVRARCPGALFIFIIPPSFEELSRRLHRRNTDSEDVIAGRLEKARVEFKEIPNYDYLVINDKVAGAVEEIEAILTAAECRVENRKSILTQFA